MYGNTRNVAEAIAAGLSAHLRVDVVEVGAASTNLGDIELLVVGGPTHAFSMSREHTRADAARQSEHGVVSTTIGIREWLQRLDVTRMRIPVATYDTRMEKPRLPGSAARAAARRLRRAGFRVISPPRSFFVTGAQGPLVPGELERARRWGDELGLSIRVANVDR